MCLVCKIAALLERRVANAQSAEIINHVVGQLKEYTPTEQPLNSTEAEETGRLLGIPAGTTPMSLPTPSAQPERRLYVVRGKAVVQQRGPKSTH
jgi:hypothetical protein